jgi:hypothetical protein
MTSFSVESARGRPQRGPALGYVPLKGGSTADRIDQRQTTFALG